MNKKRIQSTDPARKLALLWGSQRSEGRSGLTLKAILSALELADHDGLDALSMEVAEAWWHNVLLHVPSKEDLIDL